MTFHLDPYDQENQELIKAYAKIKIKHSISTL